MNITGQAALDRLSQRYRAGRGLAGASPASPVVGCVGNVIPEEVIVAAGCVPLQVAPLLDGDADAGRFDAEAGRFMEDAAPREWRSVFGQILAGAWAPAELIVVGRDYHVLYYYLKEVVRLGLGSQIPPLHMFDLIQDSGPAADAYNDREMAALVGRLARVAGRPVTAEALAAAVTAAGRRRAAQRDILALRRTGALAGPRALEVLGARYLMPGGDYADAVAALLADPPAAAAGAAARPRLVAVTAERLYHTRLHETVEAAGTTIAAELDWWGSAGVDGPVGPPGGPAATALASLTAHYRSAVYSPQLPRADRLRLLLSAIDATAADGVLFYLPPSDEELGWDVPAFTAALDQPGVPALVIRHDVLDGAGRSDIRGQLANWLSGRGARQEVTA